MDFATFILLIATYFIVGAIILTPSIVSKDNMYKVHGYDTMLMFLFWPITIFSIIFTNIFNIMHN